MKTYSSPVLTIHGDAAALTQATDHKTLVTDVVKGAAVGVDGSGYPEAFIS